MHLSVKIIVILSTILLLAVTAMVRLLQPAQTAAREPDAGTALARLTMNEELDPLAGASYYDVYLNGMRLGKATVEVQREGDNFILQVAGSLRSVINSLFTVNYRGHAVMSPNPVQPSEAMIEEQKGSKTKTYMLEFPEWNRALAVQTEKKRGKEPTRTHKEFTSERFVLDPFSAVFLARSLKWEVGDVRVVDLLTGKKQYELQLTCRGETVLAIDGQPRAVWEIALQTRSVEAPRKIKLSGFVMYLSKDFRREILKITGKHKIGRIVADMRKFEWQEEE